MLVTELKITAHINVKNPSKFRSGNLRTKKDMKRYFFFFLL